MKFSTYQLIPASLSFCRTIIGPDPANKTILAVLSHLWNALGMTTFNREKPGEKTTEQNFWTVSVLKAAHVVSCFIIASALLPRKSYETINLKLNA